MKEALTASMDSLLAWRIGRACNEASVKAAGDLIDRGLMLLRELNALGFDVSVRCAGCALALATHVEMCPDHPDNVRRREREARAEKLHLDITKATP